MGEANARRADRIREALEYVLSRGRSRPAAGIVLGSGLAAAVGAIEVRSSIPYEEIPNFPSTSVAGHPGNLVIGALGELDVVVLQGRLHYYEGYAMSDVVFPIDVLGALGVRIIVETCAAGALKPGFAAGDLVSVSDHVNLMGDNPLVGAEDDRRRFIDLADAYSPRLRDSMKRAARKEGLHLKDGVYAAVKGPSYETPAEVRFLSGIADLVGMSLAPEVIAARSHGIEVAAIAVVSNAHGEGAGVSHEEVLKVAERAVPYLERLLRSFADEALMYLIDCKGEF